MSGRGQALGAVGGAIAGYLIGGDISSTFKGALYGAQAGAYLDGPPGVDTVGPRINDLAQQSCTYGANIPRVYGTISVYGNMFWLENGVIKEAVNKTEEDGKGGGGGSTSTTYSYSATFAIGLCEGPIAGINRIWIGNKLFYNAGSTDLATVIASNKAASGFTIYLGDDTQLPDPRMQATLGVANTPAYRGLAYIVFKDLPLADYGNNLRQLQIKFEVVKVGTTNPLSLISNYMSPAKYLPGWAYTFSPVYISIDLIRRYMPYWDSNYPASSFYGIYDFRLGFSSVVEGIPIATPSNPVPPTMLSDNPNRFWIDSRSPLGTSYQDYYATYGNVVECGDLIFASGTNGARLLKKNTPLKALSEAAVSRIGTTDGTFCYDLDHNFLLRKFDNALNLLASITLSGTVDSHVFAVPSPEFRMCVWGDYLWIFSEASGTNPSLFRIDLSLTTPKFFGYLPAFSVTGTYYNIESKIIDGVIVRTCPDQVAYVERTQYVKINKFSPASAPTLDSIVNSECLKSGILQAGDIDVTGLTQLVKGYKVSAVSSITAALEPLQGAWPFDIIQHGYILKFKPRGGSSIATIGTAQLDSRSYGSSNGYLVSDERITSSTLPSKIQVVSIDNTREYDTNEQYMERIGLDFTNILQLEFAIVLSADEAIQIAERLLYLYWLEKNTVQFITNMTFNNLEPSDVITVNTDKASYTLRITEIEYTSDNLVRCVAKYHSATMYVPKAIGSNGTPSTDLVGFLSSPVFELLDIPSIESIDTSSFGAVMRGSSAGWQGGTISTSLDSGQTWQTLQGYTNPGSVFGYALNTITAGNNLLLDKASVLSVSLLVGTLSSVTEASMLNGSNYFAYGVNNRWEIIAAQTCTLTSLGIYSLTNLRRGLFGTEQYMSTHAANDVVVLLDGDQVERININQSEIGFQKSYRASSNGIPFEQGIDKLFTYTGVNLKCLSPVYLNGNRHPTTNDWTITWIRRTRIGGEWRDLVDATLSEVSESYVIEIFSDETYTTIKQTLVSNTQSVVYTGANQVADFTVVQPLLYIKIYQISGIIGRGYPAIGNFIVSGYYYAKTVALLHFDGVIGSNSIIDEKGHAFTSTALLTNTNAKFGQAVNFAGSQTITFPTHTDFDNITDFTLEYWFSGSASSNCKWSKSNQSYHYGTGIDLGGLTCSMSAFTPPSSGLHHYATTRKGSVVRHFIDGILVSTGSNGNTFTLSGGAIGYYQGNGDAWITGQMDEFRLTKLCRYTSNFTPDSIPFGDQ